MRIGIDLGGTKIEGLALADGGEEIVRRRVPTPKGYDETLDAVAALVGRLEREADATGTVGIGIPGAIDPTTGLVKNANSTWLIGQPFDQDLAARLGRPVRVMNDANCFALSEAADGAGADAEVVLGVILGTGVGGGVVVRGAALDGPNRIAGEWGHTPLPWPTGDERPGPPCYCGRSGCVETFLSGPGLERDFERHAGRRLGTREIVRQSAEGDAAAAAALSRYMDRLGRALAVVADVLDPDVVVLGGGMSNLPGIAERARGALEPYVFTDSLRTRVVLNAHGDSSGVRGAAWLWPR